ncbi:MAG: hypothetical protein D8M57_19520 [Candidatus Scalindua sp. AMX11]|nr:MAG: hypothetical protein DWQ00_19390 [Candidatus Scalindua sp.]TDE63201.1 MAG: hypothetical protein D8M57_19520 [Candidatus Scalindua sp. AMX11]GJQ57550.1 MAG: hypothetical protein SCALA701_03510 [Candidatus Scalindua sp.]
METGYGCNTVTLTDERVRNGEHKLQPVATAPALYSTLDPLYLILIPKFSGFVFSDNLSRSDPILTTFLYKSKYFHGD